MNRRQRLRGGGFSLVELLVVVVLIGLLVSMVGGSVIRNLDGVKVRRASKDLLTALRYTRGQAVVSRAEKTLEVNVEERSYKAPDKEPVSLPEGVDPSSGNPLYVRIRALQAAQRLVRSSVARSVEGAGGSRGQ